MEYLSELVRDPAAWVALTTLIAMEVILGIDNLLFISILTNKLPEAERQRARRIGIGLALVLRLALLSMVFVIVQLVRRPAARLGEVRLALGVSHDSLELDPHAAQLDRGAHE